jgi:outer membrane receptor for ferrienterochelin and colicins
MEQKVKYLKKHNHSKISFLVFLVVVIFLVNPIMAQGEGTIEGVIIDKVHGKALWNVNIIIENTHFGAASDRDGYFIVDKLPIGTYSLLFTSVGYKEIRLENTVVKSGISKRIEVILEPIILESEEIVVTGTRSDHLLKDVPVETYLLSSKEIRNIGLQTATDAIRWVPGVNISGGAPNGAARRFTAMIHGMPSQYSMILVDGERMASEHIHTGINLNLIPIGLIERIEVVKGPASALYGSEAFGGVINIITKPLPEQAFTSAEVSYGEYQTLNANISHGSTIGKFGYYFNGNFAHTDGAPDANSIRFDYNQANFMAKTSYKSSENSIIKLSTQYYENKYLRDSTKPKVTDTWLDIGAAYESRFDERSGLNAGITFSHFKGEYRDDDNKRIQATLLYDHELFNDNIITTGVELRNETFSRQATPQNETTITSGFIKNEGALSIPLTYIVALRADHHPNVGTEFTPKLAARYQFNQATDLRASIGKGFRAPSLQDLYEKEFDHSQYYRNGNPNLKPEYSINYNLSLEHYFGNRLLTRISAFRNDFKDMIQAKDTGDLLNGKPIFRRENISEAMSQGIELDSRIEFEDLKTIFSYTYCDTRDDNSQPLAYSPEHMINFRIYYFLRSLSFGTMLSVENASNRYYQKKSGGQGKLENYTLVNLHLNKNLFAEWVVFLRFENLLNQEFTIYEDGVSLAGYGRTYLLGLKVEL